MDWFAWLIVGVIVGNALACALVVCVGRESHERGGTLDFTSRDARDVFKHAGGVAAAPAATPILCAVCDTPVARFTRAVRRGEIVGTENCVLADGSPGTPGERVLCPVDPDHIGAYARVNGAVWRIG